MVGSPWPRLRCAHEAVQKAACRFGRRPFAFWEPWRRIPRWLSGQVGGEGFQIMDISGKRILIVEDEFLVALSLQDSLMSLGCVVVGPVSSLRSAIHAAECEAIDAAILDVNLRGDLVFPAADVLAARGVPMIFCSGHLGDSQFPPRHSDHLRVPKPYTGALMTTALRDLLAGQPDGEPNARPGPNPTLSI